MIGILFVSSFNVLSISNHMLHVLHIAYCKLYIGYYCKSHIKYFTLYVRYCISHVAWPLKKITNDFLKDRLSNVLLLNRCESFHICLTRNKGTNGTNKEQNWCLPSRNSYNTLHSSRTPLQSHSAFLANEPHTAQYTPHGRMFA